MRILFIVLAFVMMHQMAFASEWVLWQTVTLSENVLPDNTAIEEYPTLSACNNAIIKASDEKAAYLRSQQPSSEITNFGESVGVRLKNQSGAYMGVIISFKCYPRGKTP